MLAALEQGALDEAPELAEVARPGVAPGVSDDVPSQGGGGKQQHVEARVVIRRGAGAQVVDLAVDEDLEEAPRGPLVAAQGRAQRGQGDDARGEPMQEVGAQPVRVLHLRRVEAGGGHQVEHRAPRLRLPEPSELPRLEDAQQLGLQGEGRRPQLVEEEGVAGPQRREEPRVVLHRPRERAPGVAEQLRLQQGLGELGGAHGADVAPAAQGGQGAPDDAGHALLPHAGLPEDEQASGRRGVEQQDQPRIRAEDEVEGLLQRVVAHPVGLVVPTLGAGAAEGDQRPDHPISMARRAGEAPRVRGGLQAAVQGPGDGHAQGEVAGGVKLAGLQERVEEPDVRHLYR